MIIDSFYQDKVHPKQEKVAEELLKKIKTSQPHLLQGMKYFDFFTIVPSFRSLGNICNPNLFIKLSTNCAQVVKLLRDLSRSLRAKRWISFSRISSQTLVIAELRSM